ncbi:phosphatidylinositol 3-kinase [Pelomyxa schiedti]|nr:phosphatidylinositol 3-kinase [Pelomyxa schiedti]
MASSTSVADPGTNVLGASSSPPPPTMAFGGGGDLSYSTASSPPSSSSSSLVLLSNSTINLGIGCDSPDAVDFAAASGVGAPGLVPMTDAATLGGVALGLGLGAGTWGQQQLLLQQQQLQQQQQIDLPDEYYCSCDIPISLRVKVCALEGLENKLRQDNMEQAGVVEPFIAHARIYCGRFSDVFVTVSLEHNGQPLLPFVLQTVHKVFTSQCKWDDWIEIPIAYQDIPEAAQLVFVVWDVHSPGKAKTIGRASLALFGKRKRLRKGHHRIVVRETLPVDQSLPLSSAHNHHTHTAFPNSQTTPKNVPPEMMHAITKMAEESERLEKLTKKYYKGQMNQLEWLDGFTFKEMEEIKKKTESELGDSMVLFIQLPEFRYPVVFSEKVPSTPTPKLNGRPQANSRANNEFNGIGNVVLIEDPECGRPNLVEAKHMKLNRCLHRRAPNKDLKPTQIESRTVMEIIKYPPTKDLTVEEQDLLWKLSQHLTKNKKALTKFLLSVDWSSDEEVKHAVSLIEEWEPVEIDDAITLLSNKYPHEKVKQYAVTILSKASDEEIQAYLLQLVQSVRYEIQSDYAHQHISNFIVRRASINPILGNFFYWYLTVEAPIDSFYEGLKEKFSVSRSPVDREISDRQVNLVNQISTLQQQLKNMNINNRQKKIDKLRQMVSPGGEFSSLFSFEPLPLMLDPTVLVTGINPDSCHIFKSAKAPISLTFKTANKEPPGYRVIFKNGDDMRQDQLVLQMITLMDNLLKKESLDLKLSPYRVLATSAANGFLQPVESQCLTDIIKESNGDIHKWLQQSHPDPSSPYGIAPFVIDNFVKSCAGYSVITHILGIGDRHLENLMLTTQGNLFHIDFGYILGNEPPFKPLPPPMRICKEMVNVMGGVNSNHYRQFKQYCCESYNIIRKSSNLIISLFSLMANANIHDIALDPEKSILRLQEKLRLEMTDEEASQTMLMLITESVKAWFPVVLDSIHGIVMSLRS